MNSCPTPTRMCTKCGEPHSRRHRVIHWQSYCQKCQSDYVREWRLARKQPEPQRFGTLVELIVGAPYLKGVTNGDANA